MKSVILSSATSFTIGALLTAVYFGVFFPVELKQERLFTINEKVGEYVTVAQDKQNTLDGCYVVVEDFMNKDMAYKKALGI